MKSTHKLAAALGIFILLSVAAYFVTTSLQAADAPPAPQPTPPANEAAPALQQRQPEEGKALGSAAAVSGPAEGSVELAAAEPPSTKQRVAPLDTESTPKRSDQHATHEPSTTMTGGDGSSSSASSSGSTSGPTVSSSSSSEASSPQTSQDLSSSAPPASPSPPATDNSKSQSSLTALLTGGVASGSSQATGAPAEQPAGQVPAQPTPGTQLLPRPTLDADEPTTITSKMYREATQRPSQLVDPSPLELEKWQEFKRNYARQYASQAEEDQRRVNFVGNLRFINAFNQLSGQLYTLDVNHFADRTQQEINDLFVGPRRNHSQQQLAAPASVKIMQVQGDPQEELQAAAAGPSVDWRNLTGDAVDQGQCRDSSIFAVVASLESAINAAGATRVKLSEQQLIDCLLYAPAHEAPVCSGQLPLMQLFDTLQNRAIRFSSAEEYGAFKHAQLEGRAPPNLCELPPTSPDTRYKLGSSVQVVREHLDEALSNIGPLVIAVDASQPTFHFYKSGLYHDDACSSDTYSMHVLLVASSAGTSGAPLDVATNAVDAAQQQAGSYTIRASLGLDWGEAGHMRLLRDSQRNKCLPQHGAVYPTLAHD